MSTSQPPQPPGPPPQGSAPPPPGGEARAALLEAQRRFSDMDWHGAMEATNRALRLDPSLEAARALREQCRSQIDDLEAKLQRKKRLADVQRDIERLIEAGEIQGAAEHLNRAIAELGNEPVLADVAEAVRQAKAKTDVQRKNEWAERRKKEAQTLIDESARLAQRHDYPGAVDKLQRAQQIDPEHPQIEQLLATARTQAESYAEEEVRDRQILAVVDDVRRQLDALYLDQAETRLHMARKRFGEDPRLQPLQRRLDELRRSASATDVPLPTPENLNKLSSLEPVIRQRQRSLADAYSWSAALTYPLRRPILLLSMAAMLFAVDLLVYNFGLHPTVSLLGPLFGLILLPALVRTTLEGLNEPPSPHRLTTHARLGADSLLILGSVLVFGLPILLFVLTRPWHPLLAADAGPVGWLLLAVLGWGACALLVPAWGVASAFGGSYATRLDRLFSCLGVSSRGVLTVDAVFGFFVAGLILRAILLELVPWIGLPLLALFEAYGLVVLPHLLGVMVRDRRLEWAKIHAG